MLHRHLNHQQFTLAAIDDIISRGGREDWEALRRAALADRLLLLKIQKLCAPRLADPSAQRYYFWMQYAKKHA